MRGAANASHTSMSSNVFRDAIGNPHLNVVPIYVDEILGSHRPSRIINAN